MRRILDQNILCHRDQDIKQTVEMLYYHTMGPYPYWLGLRSKTCRAQIGRCDGKALDFQAFTCFGYKAADLDEYLKHSCKISREWQNNVDHELIASYRQHKDYIMSNSTCFA